MSTRTRGTAGTRPAPDRGDLAVQRINPVAAHRADEQVFLGASVALLPRRGRNTPGQLLAVMMEQDAHHLVVTGKATVRDWLDVWLETFVESPKRAPRIYKGYYELLKHHVPDAIGRTPLTKLAPESLQVHFKALADKGLGRTADLLRAVLRAAFNRAAKLRRMDSNPVLGTDAVRYARAATTAWTLGEAKQFIDKAAEDRLAALYVIALSLGLRKGEVCGLKPHGNRIASCR